MWWCGENLICFSGVFFWCRNGDFECEWGGVFGGKVCGVSGLRFVGLFLWTGWIFVGLFRGGIWAGLMKS